MSWPEYLDAFHDEHAGITEQVLIRAHEQGSDAYGWLAEAFPPRGRVVDVACGSAPLWPLAPAYEYIGVDVSTSELDTARARGVPHLVRATATALPLGDGSADVVACSMALQILQPLPAVLEELARVLAPGGRLVATIPAAGPLRACDYPVLFGLLATLGRTLSYPNDSVLEQPGPILDAAGFVIADDDTRRFVYRLAGKEDADRLADSLYVPGLSDQRRRAVRTWLRRAAALRLSVPVPVRRIIAVKP